MPQKINLRLLPEQAADELFIRRQAAHTLAIPASHITAIQILRRSIDARGRSIMIQLQLAVFVHEAFEDAFAFSPKLQQVAGKPEVLVAGAGPAGLFAAIRLIEHGLRPIVIERGKDVRSRRRDLAAINKEGKVNPESNYCFGEGGAGTYSDGKLYTRSAKRGNVQRCLQWFHYFGADAAILYEAHPHIGTNKLPAIISAMRNTIESCGGSVLFHAKLTDILISGNQLTGVEINHEQKLKARHLILATGHSAHDIFTLLHQKGVQVEAKPFALGVRIEHPQELIDAAQYHCPPQTARHPLLPPAAYALVSQEKGRGVFSFCMCPGGIIAPASTEEGALVVNGWSPSKRDNPYANSGMVVTVDEKDFAAYGFTGPLSGLHFQQLVEQRAWQAGGGLLKAPGQRVTDFVHQKQSASLPRCSYLPGTTPALLHQVLPEAVYQALAAGFVTFGKKIKGYYSDEGIVVATESRTSSPVRIPRIKETLQHPQIQGLYPCAEGAGYAGGIISAAMDGERVADAIAQLK